MPPARRESESSLWVSRGSRYLSCASSTWSLPSRALRALGEDVEDELRAVEDLEAGLLGDVAACEGVRSLVEDEQVRPELHRAQDQLLELAPADEVARVGLPAHLEHRVQHLDAGGARQLLAARAATPRRGARCPSSADADQHRPLAARRPARAGGGRASSSSSAPSVAARSGCGSCTEGSVSVRQ